MWQLISNNHLLRVFVAYTLFFALFFWGVHAGLGHYWDWSFPYFSDQLSTLFTNKASSWVSADMGSPLAYASDYFLRFLIALFGFLPPELVRYGLLTLIFAIGGLGVYLLARQHTSSWLAFLIGLVAFVNPAVFYKYTAGHINYLVAFTVFIYTVYFLLYVFGKNLRSAVIVGLCIAALGVQMQFFVIGAIFLIAFFAFNRTSFSWKYIAVILIIPLLVHAVWLSNFATGALSASETSSAAAQVSVKHATTSDFLSIFTFSFSKATLLSKFYAFYELLWNATLFIFMFWLLVRQRQQDTATIVLLVFFAVMMFMATGLYQTLNLGPITGLYPMLREVGHFAPVIALSALIVIARLVRQTRWRWLLTCILIGSLVIVGIKFQYYSQAYNFSEVRSKFEPFKQFADSDPSAYRILAYPFFGKYSFNHLPKDPDALFPLKNSGHDSFATFSHQEFITNAVAPHEFQESVQYKLLQDYNIDVLRPYNVKYIFDFSRIYESNYERYVPTTVYNNDISLIKNDPAFFDKLLARNPGKLKKISDTILEVQDYAPRAQATADLFTIPDKDDAIHASSFTQRALDKPLDYVLPDDELNAYTTQLTPLFSNPKKTKIDKDSGSFSQTVRGGALYANTSYSLISYERTAKHVTFFASRPGSLLLNNQLVAAGSADRRTLVQVPLSGPGQYYVSFKGVVTPLTVGGSQTLDVGKEGDTIEVFAAEADNIVPNTSFEEDLWQQTVGDCNNYDQNPKLGMLQTTQTASQGRAALELSATRHNACTSTPVTLTANTQYLLRFDYQSPNAQTANFFLSYGNDDVSFAKGFRAITDDEWHTATKLITTPDQAGAARLYLYALEQDGKQAVINRYDNVSLVPLRKIHENALPTPSSPYMQVAELSDNEQTLTFTDSEYEYRNLITNPSFERGLWQRTVSDCNKYDERADIGMELRKGQATQGNHSLALQARRHDACTRTTANITEGSDYLLTFEYQTTDAKHYGYALSFDDPQTTVTREQLPAKQGDWQRATIKVQTPAKATTLTLYLYAFEDTGKRTTVAYDNVRLAELPDFADRFYVVGQPKKALQAPEHITLTSTHPAQKDIHITKATTPFFVTLSETYNPKWRLELAAPQTVGFLQRWLPNAPAVAVNRHTEASGYMNSWLVDPVTLCGDDNNTRTGCIKHADGSYDIRLVAEFVPQRWFSLAALISWATILICGIYLVISRGREFPTYQSIRRKVLQRRRR